MSSKFKLPFLAILSISLAPFSSLLCQAAPVQTKAFNGTENGATKSVSTSIIDAAKRSVGKEMWKNGFGLPDGHLGCAASLSNVLKEAGIKYASSPVTKSVRQKLLAGPHTAKEFVIKEGGDSPIDNSTVTKVAKPGDVLVAFMDPLPRGNIGPKAHCGIIGPDLTVFTNDWNDGIWKQGDIHRYFDDYRHIRVIRLQ